MSILGDGAIDVPREVGWHSVKPFTVIPRGHQETDTDPQDQSVPTCNPRPSQAGVGPISIVAYPSTASIDVPTITAPKRPQNVVSSAM